MTDTKNNTAAPTPKAPEPKVVAEDMANRVVFTAERDDSGAITKTAVEAAQEYLEAQGERLDDFGKQTFAMAGITIDEDSGEAVWDPAIYTESMDVMVALLRKQKGGVKAIVVAPVPSISTILADTAARDWMTRILHKELNHVAVRALREAEDVSTVVDQIPVNLTGYIESGRAGAGIVETFNELYKAINATVGAKVPVWAKYRLLKSELKKAMESAGYAAETYAPLEDYKGTSLFVAAIQIGLTAAKRKGLDPAIFERWLATRDQKTYNAGAATEDEDDFDFDSLADSMLVEDAPKTDAPAADSTDAAPVADEPVADAPAAEVEPEPTA